MKEQLIGFETAKLAKKKGFNLNCGMRYNEKGVLTATKLGMNGYPNNFTDSYAASTQSLLQKWLREEHSLHISLYIQENTYLHRWRVKVFYLDKLEDPNVHFWDFDTYEEALEKGLQGALNLI